MNDIIQLLIAEAGLSDSLTIVEVAASKDVFNIEAIAEVGTPLIESVVRFARHYYGKKPLAVASSGNREDVIESLKSNGIFELFDAVVTAEDVDNPKPAPDIYLKAASLINCDPTKCRGFEDGEIGMRALVAAGMEAVFVQALDGYPTRTLE